MKKNKDIVVLDTNVFYKENFLMGKRIREFFDLGNQGHLTLLTTKIIIEEVKSNCKKAIKKMVANYGKFKNDFENKPIYNNSINKQLYQKIQFNDLVEEFNRKFIKDLKYSKTIILDYENIDIESLFNDYFSNSYPFNKGEKKHEFPDAISLKIIENWCRKNSTTCSIFSSDKDVLNTKSEFFVTRSDYELYLSDLLSLVLKERKNTLNLLFEINTSKIESDFSEWYRNKLDDFTIYYDLVWIDVHDIDVESVNVKLDGYQIISINEECIEIEITAFVKFKVKLVIDDEDNAVYDSEDKVYLFLDTKEFEIERETKGKMVISFFIVDSEEFNGDYEIVEINKDTELELRDEDDYR